MRKNLIIKNNEFQSSYQDAYIIYTRKSTDDADSQKNSIKYQIGEAIKFAKRNNFKIALVTIPGFCTNGIIEEHHSGFKEKLHFEILPDGTVKQWVDRPKFLKLVECLLHHQFKGVISLCWDRFSRNEADDVIIKKLMKKGVDILYVQATYEKSSAGFLHMDVDGMFSRHYSMVISEKVRNTAAKLRAEGKCIYYTPLGYLDKGSDNKPLDPERAHIIKKLFEMYATGEWSYTTLAQWANQNGLTSKPARRKRTRQERMEGLEMKNIPKVCRPVNAKSIENILTNPFYIGKNVHGEFWTDSVAHQPLIDTALFLKVLEIQKKKYVSIHYPDKNFFIYRGLLRCENCNRTYSPYIQKDNIYYRVRCQTGCKNPLKNVSEKFITNQVSEILDKVSFSDKELKEINLRAENDLRKITNDIDSEVEKLQRQFRKALADIDYLTREKISLLRTSSLTVEEIKNEEFRLKTLLEESKIKLESYSESAEVMLDYILTFSEMVQNKSLAFRFSLDSEKQKFVHEVFSELIIGSKELKYVAKPGYYELLHRFDCSNVLSGWADYLFSELFKIYHALRQVNRG